ncbi:MAG: TVP38/TMEM64 family protein [Gemmataceae bacterium]|nr:TVP38/TMEM64 family protein [Gemmataceae bacterium]
MLVQQWKNLAKLVLLIAFVGVAVWFFRFTDTGRSITSENIRAAIDELHPVAQRLAYIGIYIVGTILLLPGTLLSFAGAAMFGVWEGTLYTWIGATIGATAAFFVAKALGRDFVNQRLGGKLEALDRRLAQNGFVSILILRLVPLFPFNGINFGSGLTSIRAGDYILGTAVGILPGTFVFQFVFDRLAQKLGQESLTWQDWLDPVLGLALLLFVGFVVLGRWLSKKLESKSP